MSDIENMFTVENILTSESTTNALSSKQGKILNNKIGDMNNLQTTAKDNLVNAVNEVKTGLENATPSDYEQVKTDVEKLKTDVGTARTNLINSVNSTIDNL